jgi:hypothetical protein
MTKLKNDAILIALYIFFFPWMRCREGKKVFSPPLQRLSLSLSPYLTCSKTPTQPTPPMVYHQDEKTEGTSHVGGPRVVA